MSEPFLSEIKLVSFNYAPKGWAQCNGQLLPINQNQALFSLMGTTYGGDGRVTFALPDLRSRTPIHMGNGFVLGEVGGQESHVLGLSEMPAHTHVGVASAVAANSATPAGNRWADGGKAIYAAGVDSAMASNIVSNAGGSQAHANMSPFLTLNFCIALQGYFPSQT